MRHITTSTEALSGTDPFTGAIMAVVRMAILAGLPYTDLRDAVFTHPTMAEGLGPLFSNVPPRLS
jgi:hypothetical protein